MLYMNFDLCFSELCIQYPIRKQTEPFLSYFYCFEFHENQSVNCMIMKTVEIFIAFNQEIYVQTKC